MAAGLSERKHVSAYSYDLGISNKNRLKDRFHLCPLISERRCINAIDCDFGTDKNTLQKRFPFVSKWTNYPQMPDIWWSAGKEPGNPPGLARAQKVVAWLATLPFSTIALVGHAQMFKMVFSLDIPNAGASWVVYDRVKKVLFVDQGFGSPKKRDFNEVDVASVLHFESQRYMRILLIRHGQGHHNVAKNYQLRDPELTIRGQTQARMLGSHLRKLMYDGEMEQPRVIYVSPLKRTIQTALLVFGDGGIGIDERQCIDNFRVSSRMVRGNNAHVCYLRHKPINSQRDEVYLLPKVEMRRGEVVYISRVNAPNETHFTWIVTFGGTEGFVKSQYLQAEEYVRYSGQICLSGYLNAKQFSPP